MRILLPGTARQEPERKEESLYKSIIQPAIKLAERIQISPEKFTFEFSQFAYVLERDEQKNPPGISEEIAKLDCLNLLQGGKAVSASVIRDESTRGNVLYLLDVFPELSCQTFNGDIPSEIQILKKSTVLVAIARPGKEDSGQIREGPTLIEFIYDQVHSRSHRIKRGLLW